MACEQPLVARSADFALEESRMSEARCTIRWSAFVVIFWFQFWLGYSFVFAERLHQRESNKFPWLYSKENNLKSHKFHFISSLRFQRYFALRYAYTEQTILTVANLSIHSSGAPNDARPISCSTNQEKIKEALIKNEIFQDVSFHRKTMLLHIIPELLPTNFHFNIKSRFQNHPNIFYK